MAANPAKEVGLSARTRMRIWVREHDTLSVPELRQAAIFAFSDDTAMVHEALGCLAHWERSNDHSIDRRRHHRAFQEVMEGQRTVRVLDFLEDWYETLDGRSLKVLDMTRNEMITVLQRGRAQEQGIREHYDVVEAMLNEFPESYAGIFRGVLKKNKQSRNLLEAIVTDYREETE